MNYLFMKKTTLAFFVFATMFLAFSTFAPAQESVSPLGYMPESATIAVYVPSVTFVDETAAPIIKVSDVTIKFDYMAIFGDLPEKLGVEKKTMAAVFTAAGLDATKPVALFLSKGADGQPEVSGVLPVSDEKLAAEKLKLIFDGTPEEITVGEVKGLMNPAQKVGYFISKGNAFLGSNQELLNQLAARAATPATFAYTPSKDLKEVAVITSFSKIQTAGGFPAAAPGMDMTPTYDFFHGFIEEIVLGLGVENGEAYLRLMTQDPKGDVAAPATPLTLHKIFPADAPIKLNLRNNAALIDKVSALLAGNPAMAKNMMYVKLVSQILGDQMAVAVKGITNNIPDGLLAVTLIKPESIKGLMGIAGIKGEPKYQHNNVPVYVMENVKEGLNIYIATAGTLLLVSTNEDTLKTALNSVSPDGTINATASSVDVKLLERGVNGFVSVDGSKIDPAQLAAIAPDLNFGGKQVALTLGIDKNWRTLRLAVPGGMQNVADLAGQLSN